MSLLKDTFGDTQLGRPHIAQLMRMNGFVESIDEAFDNYIGKDKPAYVDKYRVGCQEAIELIGNAGGIDLQVNGRPIKNLGETGQVVRLKLPEDYERGR